MRIGKKGNRLVPFEMREDSWKKKETPKKGNVLRPEPFDLKKNRGRGGSNESEYLLHAKEGKGKNKKKGLVREGKARSKKKGQFVPMKKRKPLPLQEKGGGGAGKKKKRHRVFYLTRE